jgi:hypothetical protein
MTLLDYLRTLDEGLFLTDGARAWSVPELRARLEASALGAPADRLAFDGPVHVGRGDGTPWAAVPPEVETAGVQIPQALDRSMRERLARRVRLRVLTRDGRLYQGVTEEALTDHPPFAEQVRIKAPGKDSRHARVFHAHRRPDRDAAGVVAYAEDGVDGWNPGDREGDGRLWTLVPSNDGWRMTEVRHEAAAGSMGEPAGPQAQRTTG